MSDVASSFTILEFQGFPQNSLNHRVTTFLLSCDIAPSPFPFCRFCAKQNQPRLDARSKQPRHTQSHPISVSVVPVSDSAGDRRSVIGWFAGPKLLSCPQTHRSTPCENSTRSPPCAAMDFGRSCKRCSIALPSTHTP